MARMQILLTNDDGWDAPGLAALKELAAPFGDIHTVAPRDPHSYAGHRVTTDVPLTLIETGPREYHLSGTPADCVRVALTSLLPRIDFVLSGINRGGNLGADIHSSGTVAAAREAALLGRHALAISQYVRRDLPLNWSQSVRLALPVVERILKGGREPRGYWNLNLPHVDADATPDTRHCEPDSQPLDVQFERTGNSFRYTGTYATRPRTSGCDVDCCFQGAITVSLLRA